VKYSVAYFVALLEALYSTGDVPYFLLTGKEGVTLAADFHLECRLGGAGSEGVAADAGYFSLGIVFRVNLLFHFGYWRKR